MKRKPPSILRCLITAMQRKGAMYLSEHPLQASPELIEKFPDYAEQSDIYFAYEAECRRVGRALTPQWHATVRDTLNSHPEYFTHHEQWDLVLQAVKQFCDVGDGPLAVPEKIGGHSTPHDANFNWDVLRVVSAYQ